MLPPQVQIVIAIVSYRYAWIDRFQLASTVMSTVFGILAQTSYNYLKEKVKERVSKWRDPPSYDTEPVDDSFMIIGKTNGHLNPHEALLSRTRTTVRHFPTETRIYLDPPLEGEEDDDEENGPMDFTIGLRPYTLACPLPYPPLNEPGVVFRSYLIHAPELQTVDVTQAAPLRQIVSREDILLHPNPFNSSCTSLSIQEVDDEQDEPRLDPIETRFPTPYPELPPDSDDDETSSQGSWVSVSMDSLPTFF